MRIDLHQQDNFHNIIALRIRPAFYFYSYTRADVSTRRITLVKRLQNPGHAPFSFSFPFLSSLYGTAWFHCAPFSSHGRFCVLGLLPDHQPVVSSLPSTASAEFPNHSPTAPSLRPVSLSSQSLALHRASQNNAAHLPHSLPKLIFQPCARNV